MGAARRIHYASLGLAAACVVLVCLVAREAALEWAVAGTAWCRGAGVLGMAVFAVVYAVSIVLCIPSAGGNVLAGVLWGVWAGSAVAFVGSWAGVLLILAGVRLVGAERLRGLVVAGWLEEYVGAFGRAGWQLALALRVTPVVPDNLLNYVLAVSDMDAWTAAWTAAVGGLPGLFLFTYVGVMAGDAAEGLREAESMRLDARHVAGMALAAAVSAALLAWATRLVRAELRRGREIA